MMFSYMILYVPLLQMRYWIMWEARKNIHLQMDSHVTIRSKYLQRTCIRLLFLQNGDPTNIQSFPLDLNKAPSIFSMVVIVVFKEFINQFLEVYLDDWTVYSILKYHVEVLSRLMLERCKQCQISLNIKKCIFGTPFGILLGHIVCKQGLLVDPTKIVVIVNLPPPKSVRQLRATLRHTGYYRKFINGYAKITAPMEKLLKKDTIF
jgi:hypothetical protein